MAKEGEQLKAYGAGLLSSFGELERFQTHARLLPLDIDAMVARPYDPTVYQEVLYVAPSFEDAVRTVTRWLDSVAG